MEVGFIAKNLKDGDYLYFNDIRKITMNYKRVGEKLLPFYTLYDYDKTEYNVSADQYELVWVLDGIEKWI